LVSGVVCRAIEEWDVSFVPESVDTDAGNQVAIVKQIAQQSRISTTSINPDFFFAEVLVFFLQLGALKGLESRLGMLK